MAKYFGKHSVFNDTAYRNYFLIENTLHFGEDEYPECVAAIDEWSDNPEDIHKTINWGNALLFQTKYNLWGKLRYIFGRYRTVCFPELIQYNSPYETDTIKPDGEFGLMIMDEINRRDPHIAYTIESVLSNGLFKALVDGMPDVRYPDNYRPGILTMTLKDTELKHFITAYQAVVKALPFQGISGYMKIAAVSAIALASQPKNEKDVVFWWTDPAYDNPFDLTFATRSSENPITEVKVIHAGGLSYIIEVPRPIYDKLFKAKEATAD